MVNVDKIKGRMKEKRITQSDLANALNIGTSACNHKLNNNGSCFDLNEAYKVAQILEISDDEFGAYFFAE